MKSFQYLAPIPSFEYVAPRTLSELFEALDGHGKKLAVLAGGTDLMISLKGRMVDPEVVVDLRRLREEFGGIGIKDGVLRIGSLATFSQVESSPFIARYANALRQAAEKIGTIQIRTNATLGGNIETA